MQPPTEDLILEIINKHRLVSADELSRMLFMTKPNIQYHLKKMLQKGLVEVSKGDKWLSQRPGRPELFYRLSGITVGNNITQLCDHLLDQQKSLSGKKKLYQMLAKQILPPAPASSPIPRLLNTLVDELNQRAYCCRWEAHKAGPVIMFSNCPYAEIIDRHPDLCLLDVYLLEVYLRFPVQQIARIDPRSRIPPECQFSVRI